MYLINKLLVGRVIVAAAPELCQKCDFSLHKRMQEMFAYVLECMLTLAKMQDNSTLATMTRPTKILLSRYTAGFISDKYCDENFQK